MKRITVILFYSSVFFLLSCNSKKESQNTNNIALKIDSISISYNEIDNRVKQELFDELNRIYIIRKIATDNILNEKILTLEAKKNNISVDKLLNTLYSKKITNTTLTTFSNNNNFNKGILAVENQLKNYHPNSKKGKSLLISKYKEVVLKNFIDSIKKNYHIETFLKAPLSPKIDTKNLLIHYKGNLNSKITFLQISDFECGKCKEYAPSFEALYNKYKNDVRFGYTYYGSYVSNSAIAAVAAEKQRKFWKMHDAIFANDVILDKNELFKIASDMGLDMLKFKNDFNSDLTSKKIEKNFEKLSRAGVYGTPSIMINNRLVFDSSSINEIEKKILNEINKLKK